MYTYVVEDYQRWADRGYLTKLACPRHEDLSCLISVDEKGIYIKCPLCLYKKIIGRAEYEHLEKSVARAKQTFKEE
jgi:hypothetical protein